MILRTFIVSDIHSPDSFQMMELKKAEYDLVLTLGDIPRDTLNYILFMSKEIQSYGVLGNHDPKEILSLNNIHCKVVDYNGIRIGGFGGALKYKDEPNHYTENEVTKNMQQMPPVDIFISHAAPFCVPDPDDTVHNGFKAFDNYMIRNKPKYWLHGHLGIRQHIRKFDTEIYSIVGKQPLILKGLL